MAVVGFSHLALETGRLAIDAKSGRRRLMALNGHLSPSVECPLSGGIADVNWTSRDVRL
jgi:hypothetical protein